MVTLSGANAYTGATTISGGTLALSGAGGIAKSSGVFLATGATFDISGATSGVSITTLGDSPAPPAAGIVTLGANTLTLTNQSSTFSGAIGGTGGLTLTGAGAETLAGVNNYTGATTITNGTLTLAGAGTLGAATSAVSVSGGILNLGGTTQINHTVSLSGGTIENGSLTGAITSTNGVINGLGGTATLATTAGSTKLLGTNSYSGATAVTGSTLVGGAANAFSATSATTINVGGIVNLGGFAQTINKVALAGGTIESGQLTGAITSSGGTVSGLGGTATLTTTGGLTTLFGANTYTGATTITGSILRGGSANAFSAVSATTVGAGGTIDFNGFAQTINNLALAGGTIEHTALSGVIVSTGGFFDSFGGTASLQTTAGTTTLLGTNTYTGATTVTGGTLLGGAANAFSAASSTTIDTGGIVDLGGFAQTINNVALAGGTIQDGQLTGAIVSTGGAINGVGGSATVTTTAGATTLLGANSYAGATAVNGATLLGGATNSFSAVSATTINTGGIVNLGGFAQTINHVALAGGAIENGQLTGAIGSTGGTVNGLGGSATLSTTAGTTTLLGTNSYAGATTVTGSTLLGGAANVFSAASATTVNADGIVDLGGFAQAINNVTVAGGTIKDGTLTSTGTINLQSGTASAALAGSASVSKTTSGAATLSGANAYTGGTSVSAGTLNVAGVGTLGAATNALTVSGGVLDLGGTTQTQNGGLTLAGGRIQNGSLSSSGVFALQNGTISASLVGAGSVTSTGAVTLSGINTYSGSTNVASGTLLLTGAIGDAPSGPITVASGATFEVNGGSINITGNLTNNGTVIVPTTTSLTIANAFVNNGVLDIRGANGGTANALTIQGGYQGTGLATSNLDINLVTTTNSTAANTLTIKGTATGATTVNLTDANRALFTTALPVITVGAGSTALFQVSKADSVISSNFLSLVTYRLIPVGNQWDLISALNTNAVAGIGGSIGSAIGSATTGFFQGFTAFIGSPQNPTPNTVSGGVWNRDAAGVNDERSVAQSTGVAAQPLDTITHFNGVQVGSDIGLFNINNSAWNIHGGLTGGEYQASSSELDGSNTTSYFKVPFLGVYGAVSGHNFSADLLYRHDFWQGNVTSPGAGLTDTTLNGNGDAVTVDANYKFAFSNGIGVTPSAGFSYTRATFNALTLLPNSNCGCTNLLKMAPITSELGRLGVTVSDIFSAGDWALSPFATTSVWHEFADPISGVFTSNFGGANFVDPYSNSRVGTFAQFGLGIAGQPIKNPNLTINLRADYRTGENITGGTFTGAIRYQF